MLGEGLGKIHFWLTFFGVYAIFVPFHIQGMVGHPRRIAEAIGYDFLHQVQPLHVVITIAAIVTVSAQFIFLFNLVWSLVRGKASPLNPWEATSLEWITASPPPHDNFGDTRVQVFRGPYEFSLPGSEADFEMQNSMPVAASSVRQS